jgi:hypothetical protein
VEAVLERVDCEPCVGGAGSRDHNGIDEPGAYQLTTIGKSSRGGCKVPAFLEAICVIVGESGELRAFESQEQWYVNCLRERAAANDSSSEGRAIHSFNSFGS